MSDVWMRPDGSPMDFQDGDYVRIKVSEHPPTTFVPPFLSGYVRGYDMSTVGDKVTIGYTLFKVGNPELHGVREDRLELAPSQFSPPHGKGHKDGRACHLCGANL